MATGYYRQIVKALRVQGFERVRQGKGSHEIWASTATGTKVAVPRNLLSRHTANGILRDAGATRNCDVMLIAESLPADKAPMVRSIVNLPAEPAK